jgi:hypothetical protein
VSTEKNWQAGEKDVAVFMENRREKSFLNQLASRSQRF